MNKEKKDIFDKLMSLPVLRIFEPFYKKHKEILLYLFFGVLTTLVSFATFWYLADVLMLNEHAANIISWILAVLCAFVTNRIWVFDAAAKNTRGLLMQMIMFYASRLSTLAVEEVIIYIFITRMELPNMPVKLAASVIVVILNYVLSKLVVFTKK